MKISCGTCGAEIAEGARYLSTIFRHDLADPWIEVPLCPACADHFWPEVSPGNRAASKELLEELRQTYNRRFLN